MAEVPAGREYPTAPGLDAHPDCGLEVAALRYFETHGPFAAAIRAATGMPIPGPLAAVAASGTAGDGPLILAWRSPTETLALTADRTRLARLATDLAAAAGGCFVDLTGGLTVLRLWGEGVAELLGRLAGEGAIPRLNESRPSRLADVPAIAVCVQAGETLLVVDRAYAEHLRGWIQATRADWSAV